MNSRVSGNVKDLLTLIFLTLEPQNYSNFIKTSNMNLRALYFRNVLTSNIGKSETMKKTRAGKPSRLVSAILQCGFNISKHEMGFNIFYSAKELESRSLKTEHGFDISIASNSTKLTKGIRSTSLTHEMF